jgi:hypothetical protein
MPLVLTDRVKETSITTGAGSLALGGAMGGNQSFASGVGNGNSTYYAIENFKNWEVGVGTYYTDGNTLSRDTVLSSSNDNDKIELNGVSIVFVTYPASKAFAINTNGYASGISSSYSGISFPDGTLQTTASPLEGGGSENALAYWDGSSSLSNDTNLKWEDSTLKVTGSADFSGDVTIGGDATTTGNVTIDGDTTTNGSVSFIRTTAGNVFHAYVDNSHDRTIGLYLDNSSSPTWKLGLKTSPSSITTPPNQGYAYGNNGSVGMYATTDSTFIMNYANGFWVSHQGANLLNIDRAEGTFFYNDVASAPALVIRGAAAQSANLQQWSDSGGDSLSVVTKDGHFGINRSSADYTVDINGTCRLNTLRFADGTSQTTAIATDTNPDHTHPRGYTTIADNTVLTISHDAVFVDSSSSSVTITLPTAVDNGGEEFTIKRATGNNIVTINTYSSETIDGESSFNIEHPYEAITIVSNNSNWYLI